MFRNRSRRGFAIVELPLVLFILSALLAAAVFLFTGTSIAFWVSASLAGLFLIPLLLIAVPTKGGRRNEP